MNNWKQEEGTVKLRFFGLDRIVPYVKPYWKNVLFMLLAVLGESLLAMCTPLFQRYAIDHFIEAGTTAGLGSYTVVYVAAIVVQVLCGALWTLNAMKVEMYVGRDLRRDAFNHLQTLSFTYFNQNAVGYIHARVVSDTNRIAGTASWGIMDLFWSIIYLIGTCGVMIALDWKLGLIIVAITPVVMVLGGIIRRKVVQYNRVVREINSRITGNFNEGITGAKTTKTLVIEDKMEGEFNTTTEEMRHTAVKTARFNALFVSTTTFICTFAIAITLYYGGKLSMEHAMMIGTLSAFTTYAINIVDPVQSIARVITDMVTVQVNIERFTRLLGTKPEIVDSPAVVEKYGDAFDPKRENWEPIHGDIEFRDVSFMYPDGTEYVLEHFNLKVPAGTCVAIVGETGAGKSTLVNLVCRFYEPTSGQILIDGRDYRERSQLWLHSNIGYVLQSPHLFSGSVLENLRYGNLNATMEEIEAAVDAVSARGIIEKLEHGYDSDVGESGDLLSTGEKQLLSFARAILADPHIFVLDEATSSVDTLTEQLIQNAIEKLLEGRTSFLIAHRLSTIRHADVILVVRGGKIIEQGTHDELLKRRGYYHSLYTRQYQEEAMARSFEKN
ncbi:MAG: ABC transporter ATP-binding protein [Ruminococcaceae bacterium]|nr:ABC transporter ATP-binding protein [Oscillospiraceae bacterium]